MKQFLKREVKIFLENRIYKKKSLKITILKEYYNIKGG